MSTVPRPSFRRALLLLAGVFSVLCGAFSSSQAADRVSLAWDASPDSHVIGYRVYVGTTSGDYGQIIDAGNATTTTISQLTVGVTYYLVVTAYDSFGRESIPTGEAIFTATPNKPKQAISALERLPDGTCQFVVTNPAGASVAINSLDVYVSNDLKTWSLLTHIASADGKVVITDPSAAWVNRRFYRVAVQ